jgi:hypothetical protein
MKFDTQRTIRLAAGLALAAASSLTFAQASRSPYYRNHESVPSAGNASGLRDTGASGGSYGLREDMTGTVVSDREAAQLCGVLSNDRKREDCVASLSGDTSSMSRGASDTDGTTTRGSNRRGAEDVPTMPRR